MEDSKKFISQSMFIQMTIGFLKESGDFTLKGWHKARRKVVNQLKKKD